MRSSSNGITSAMSFGHGMIGMTGPKVSSRTIRSRRARGRSRSARRARPGDRCREQLGTFRHRIVDAASKQRRGSLIDDCADVRSGSLGSPHFSFFAFPAPACKRIGHGLQRPGCVLPPYSAGRNSSSRLGRRVQPPCRGRHPPSRSADRCRRVRERCACIRPSRRCVCRRAPNP